MHTKTGQWGYSHSASLKSDNRIKDIDGYDNNILPMQAWIMFLILVSALKFDKQEKAMHGILVNMHMWWMFTCIVKIPGVLT